MAVELKIKPRDKKNPRALRKEGTIPATIYGPDFEATDIQLSAKDFSRLPVEEYTHLIHLKSDADEHEVLIKDIQKDFVTRQVMNIQFYKIKRGHKVNMRVALKFTGVSNAVRLGADFVAPHKEVHVRCFPRHIPQFIEVNISTLENPGDTITFADLVINKEEIEILDPAKEIVCKAETKKTDHTIEPVAPIASAEAAPAGDSAKKDDDKARAKKD
jgi:large subunit ribosomal protein L25